MGPLYTIVEMKGKDEGSLKHGIEQMLALRDRLKSEFSAHFPLGLKAIFQGILLCPFGAQVPRLRIEDKKERGFVVAPFLYSQKAELFPYVCKRNKVTDRYAHQKLAHSEGMNLLERLFIQRAMPHHIEDASYHKHRKTGSKGGVYINYALSDANEYAALITSNAQNRVVVKAQGNQHNEAIRAALKALGMDTKFPCVALNDIDNST